MTIYYFKVYQKLNCIYLYLTRQIFELVVWYLLLVFVILILYYEGQMHANFEPQATQDTFLDPEHLKNLFYT